MRNEESKFIISISDWLFISQLKGDDIEIRSQLIRYYKLQNSNVGQLDIIINRINEIFDIINNEASESYNIVKTFKYDGIEYGIIPDMYEMLTSEWIDIDNSKIEDDEGKYENDILMLMSILYRPVKKIKWFNRKINKYTIDKYTGSHENFGNIDINIYLSAKKYLDNFRNDVISNLEYLYPTNGSNTSNDNFNFSAEKGFAEQYNWYNLVYAAANEQYLNINRVLDTNAIEFLEFVNYWNRKQELERARINRDNK